MPASAQIDLIARDKTAAIFKRVMGTMRRVRDRMLSVSKAARNMLLIGGGAVALFLRNAEKQLVAEAKLAAILKTTQHAAGLSAEQLKEEAKALQEITKFGDEAVIALQTILATFKNIKGDVFKETTKAILDMSTIMETGLKENAIQVGKALNNPIKGVSALTRVGVEFTKEQIKMIKVLVETGDVAGAQAVILKELQGEFGGAAEAAANTFGGKLRQLLNMLGDVTEEIGGAFIPDLERLIESIKEVVPRIQNWVKDNKELILSIAKWTLAIGSALILFPKLITAVIAASIAIKGLTTAVVASKVALLALAGSPVIAGLIALGVAATTLGLKIRKIKGDAEDLAKALDQETSILNKISEVRGERRGAGSLEKQITATEKLVKLNKDLLEEQETTIRVGFKKFRFLKDEQETLKRNAERETTGTRNRLENRKKELAELRRLKFERDKALEEGRPSRELQEAIDEMTKKLREQVEVFGLSADAIVLHQLVMKGATGEQLKGIKALQETKRGLEKDKTAADAAADAIKSLTNEVDVLSGVVTPGELQLIDLKNLGVAKDDLETIRKLLEEKRELEKKPVAAQFVGLQDLFKRIQASAASPSSQNSLANAQKQTITATKQTTAQAKKIAEGQEKVIRIAKDVLAFLGDIRDALPFLGRFGT